MLVFMEGGKLDNPEKNPRSNDENQCNKLNPHMTPGPGIEPGPHNLVESERSHLCAIPAPKKKEKECGKIIVTSRRNK